MSWLQKLLPGLGSTTSSSKVPSGLWVQCNSCETTLYGPELQNQVNVCPECGNHMLVSPRERFAFFLDEDDQQEIGANIETLDRLRFKDLKRYRDRLNEARKNTSESEALLVVAGKLKCLPLVCSAFDFRFMGGSMGSVVGERFSLACDYALEHKVPHICFTASGGARMQEGLFSLMQMAKTSAMIAQMRKAALPYIVVLTNPTYGGVTASLAMLGDIIVAEPGASVGFAGRRVIEQTVHEQLPEGFQTSEFIFQQGAIDMIMPRTEMRDRLYRLLVHLSSHLSRHNHADHTPLAE